MLQQKYRFIQYGIIAISAILLLSDIHSSIRIIFLSIGSIMLIKNPSNYIPLIFISSISSTITVFPQLAGIFYYLILFAISLLINHTPTRHITQFPIIIYIACIIISTIFSITNDWYSTFRLIITSFLIIFCSKYKIDTKSCEKTLAISIEICAFYIFIKIQLFPVITGFGNRISIAENLNPNTLAQFILLSYTYILTYCFKYKKIIPFITAILLLYTLIIIGSRTSYAAALLLSFIFLVFLWDVSKTKRLIICSILIIVFLNIIGYAYVYLNDRINLFSIIEDEGSGRFITWKYMFLNVIPKHLTWGIGYGRDNLEKLGYSLDADNMYIDAICQIGIIGLSALIIVLLHQLIQINRSLKKDITQTTSLLFVLAIFIIGIGETVFDTTIFWFIILYSNLSIIHQPIKKHPYPRYDSL